MCHSRWALAIPTTISKSFLTVGGEHRSPAVSKLSVAAVRDCGAYRSRQRPRQVAALKSCIRVYKSQVSQGTNYLLHSICPESLHRTHAQTRNAVSSKPTMCFTPSDVNVVGRDHHDSGLRPLYLLSQFRLITVPVITHERTHTDVV